jgi:hypothetical protein
MVNNSPDIKKTTSPLKSLVTRKTMIYANGNPGSGLVQAQTCSCLKLDRVRVMVFNTTFNNILVIVWQLSPLIIGSQMAIHI